MSIRLSRRETASLRDLAREAWEAELHEALESLFEDFCRRADNDCSRWKMVGPIHAFHDGVARELFKRCAGLRPPLAVARAIAVGAIGQSALSASLQDKLADEVDVGRRLDDTD